MKHLSNLLMLFIAAILIGTSCKKQTGQAPDSPAVLRNIEFSLYTDKDFSDNNENITFTLSIQNSRHQILWDSALTPIKIKDIPDLTHKLVIQKTVSDKDNSPLKVGFFYSIENVGNSWFFDTTSVGETFKKVEFNFH